MRVLERRLRRLEVGLLPLAETELRRLHEIVLSIRRCRAARLGLPVQEDVPAPAHRPGVSIGDTIRAGVQHMRARWAAEEAGIFSDARCAGILA
jgi:predicted nuclease with RNAse H fold